MSDSPQSQTLALMGQAFLAQALSSGGSLDSAITEMLLNARAVTGREKAAVALTGRIRSDAAMLRQGANNAFEGASMASSISAASLSLGETLSKMQTLVQSALADPSIADSARAAFGSLAANLSAVVSGTRYNGISLLDKDAWAGDERLTVSGDTASLSLQLGQGVSAFRLQDLSSLKALEGKGLAAASQQDLQDLFDEISLSINKVNTMASGYEALAGSYASEARHLESQAGILDQAAARTFAAAGTGGSGVFPMSEEGLRNLFIDIVLRDQGKLIDTPS